MAFYIDDTFTKWPKPPKPPEQPPSEVLSAITKWRRPVPVVQPRPSLAFGDIESAGQAAQWLGGKALGVAGQTLRGAQRMIFDPISGALMSRSPGFTEKYKELATGRPLAGQWAAMGEAFRETPPAFPSVQVSRPGFMQRAPLSWVGAVPEEPSKMALFGQKGAIEAINPLTWLPVGKAAKLAPKAVQQMAKDAALAAKAAAKAAPEVKEAMIAAAEAGRPTFAPSLGIKAGGKKPVVPKVSEVPPVGKSVAGGVPPELPKPPTAMGAVPGPTPTEFAGNIRLEKYPEEVRATIKEWADTHVDEVAAARRGVRSDAQVLADAKALGEEVGIRRWKPGKAYNAEELLALRGSLRSKTEAVLSTQKVVRNSNSTDNLLKLELALREQAALQEAVTGVTAEAGRSLRQFRQEVLSASGDAARLERLLKQVGGREKVEDIARLIGDLDINDPVAVNQFIRSLQKPGLWDYITELYYNSILSGPKTHIVNSLSNTVNAFSSSAERFVAAVVEVPLSKLQGRARARLFAEVPADAFGAIEGIKDGVRAFGRTMKTGITPEQASKFEMRRTRAFTGPAGRVINIPSTTLEAADAMMYQVNYRAAFRATAKRMSRGSVERYAELVSNPTKELMSEANRVAEYRLFRQEPGKFTSYLMGLRESLNIGGFKPLRYIVPFIRTPANLLKYGLERSPGGWLNPKLWKNIAAKNPEAADQIARAAMGSVAASAIGWYVMEGRITGAAPTNPAERDRFYRDGKQPFSVRVGDKWVSYQRLEPFNQTFSQVAAAIEALKEKDKDASGKVVQAVSTISQNLVSQTYMSGLSNAIDMIAQPERYAGDVFTRFATALGTPMSSATRTVAQVFDPTVRQPETLAESFKAGIPGLSRQVPPKLTAFGEEVQRKSPAWSPINVTPSEETPLTNELNRLKVNTGFVGDSIDNVELSREEQFLYQMRAGQEVKTALEQLMFSRSYLMADDAKRLEKIDKEVREARERVRKALIELIGSTTWKQRTLELQKR